MAKREDVIHEVTIEGLYTAAGGEGGKLLQKPYEITILVRDSQARDPKGGALSIFKHGPGPKALKYRDPAFVGIIEHHIKETKTPGKDLPSNIELMSRAQCATYIEREELPVEHTLYRDADSLQQAIKSCEDDEQAFLKQQTLLASGIKRRPGGEHMQSAMDLNSFLWGEGGALDETPVLKTPKPPKTANGKVVKEPEPELDDEPETEPEEAPKRKRRTKAEMEDDLNV